MTYFTCWHAALREPTIANEAYIPSSFLSFLVKSTAFGSAGFEGSFAAIAAYFLSYASSVSKTKPKKLPPPPPYFHHHHPVSGSSPVHKTSRLQCHYSFRQGVVLNDDEFECGWGMRYVAIGLRDHGV
ncbi:hypothetical protein PIB30_034519 [Stylosanthes scabra]|uniref:Uncharacterized protein n=1 Tax=Stylosanthes scabra TaxID=79078 RepID=A0ABU6QCC8_9FABA|nr:hypothetical protein [Stylosanthes scabra]